MMLRPSSINMVARKPSLYNYLSRLTGQVLFMPMTDPTGSTTAQILKLNGVSSAPISGATPGTTPGIDNTTCFSFDGINDFVNYYSTQLNAAFNRAECTINLFFKMRNAAAWTAATQRTQFSIRASGIDLFELTKTTVSGQMFFNFRMNGVAKGVTVNGLSSLDFLMYTFSWSKAADRARAYINAVQQGTTQTGLGTWSVFNLSSGNCVFGCANTSAASPSNGFGGYLNIFNRELSPLEIAKIYDVSNY